MDVSTLIDFGFAWTENDKNKTKKNPWQTRKCEMYGKIAKNRK